MSHQDILHGNNLDLLAAVRDNFAHAVVTDPPYGLGFMGKDWDSALPDPRTWAECLRVLRPGGHLVAFGAPRLVHRLTCQIEDAGFEVRDQLLWVFGSGFPKSLDVSKAIDKQDAVEEQEARRLRFTAWVRSTGVTSKQIDEATGTNMGGHYMTAASQPAIMTREHLDACRHLFGQVPEWVEQEANIRTVESQNLNSREVVGTFKAPPPGGVAYPLSSRDGLRRSDNPATDAARQWSGWGTALKPAYESIVLARKPLDGTVAQTAQRWGTGAINVDACRVPSGDVRKVCGSNGDNDRGRADAQRNHKGHTSDPAVRSPLPEPNSDPRPSAPGCALTQTLSQDSQDDCLTCPRCGGELAHHQQADARASSPQQRGAPEPPCRCTFEPDNLDCLSTLDDHTTPHVERQTTTGRWPANLILDEDAGAMLDAQSGERHGGGHDRNNRNNNGESGWGMKPNVSAGHSDSGGASRFFYCPKASRSEREAGLDHLPTRVVDPSREEDAAARDNPRTGAGRSGEARRNHHATVKPIDLMRWLVRLVTPPGGMVLEPFAGSGTTPAACALEDVDCLAMELDADYVEIARARVAHAVQQREEELAAKIESSRQMDLFAMEACS